MSLAIVLLALTSAPRIALVVAIDAYGFSMRGLSPDRRLSAAENDAATATGMLALVGFTSRQLTQKAATRAAIQSGLDSLVARAGPGTDVAFYFSGCGGNSGDTRKEPTLVPADGLERSPQNDLPMSRVEAMARAATAKGARVTVIVDACFTPPAFVSRSLEARAYKDIPKCVARKGAVRPDLFRGPGTFLCPAWSSGQAYEWRDAGATSSWTSAFTDVLAEKASDAALKGALPTVQSLAREIAAYFKPLVGASYMPNFHPFPPNGTVEDAPFLTASPPPVLTNPTLVEGARRRAAREAKNARTLRIAVDLDPAVATTHEAALRSRIVDLKEALERVDGDLRIVSDYEREPDRVATLSDEGGLTATVQGGDLTKAQRHAFSGADPEAIVAEGWGTYLETELLAKRLWNIASAGGRMDWTPRMVRETIAPGEHIEIEFDAPKPGTLLLLNRDDADGQIKLMAPYWAEPDLHFDAGPHKAPKYYANDPGRSTPGDSVVVAIFVPGEATSLPILPAFVRAGDHKAQERDFARPLVEYLRALLALLDRPDAVYGVSRLRYKIP